MCGTGRKDFWIKIQHKNSQDFVYLICFNKTSHNFPKLGSKKSTFTSLFLFSDFTECNNNKHYEPSMFLVSTDWREGVIVIRRDWHLMTV